MKKGEVTSPNLWEAFSGKNQNGIQNLGLILCHVVLVRIPIYSTEKIEIGKWEIITGK